MQLRVRCVEPSDGAAPIKLEKAEDVADVIEKLTAKLCGREGGAFSTTAAPWSSSWVPDVPDSLC